MQKNNLIINWSNETDKKEIELTVGLPAYRAKSIIWLALESLKNQVNINFGWELIVMEENAESKDVIESFIDKLPGCQRIILRNVEKKILLVDKWIGIAKDASATSRIFALQAADDYSPPKRLWIHYQHFQNRNCYMSTEHRDFDSRQRFRMVL